MVCEDKEEVGEAVDICRHRGIGTGRIGGIQFHNAPFRPAADGAGNMALGRHGVAARDDKTTEWRE